MSYLIIPEFKRAIQIDNLNQVISNDMTILNDAILDAQKIARSYLVQKFLIDAELSDTSPYDPTLIYSPGARVYLDAPAYSGALTYALGALVAKDNVIYKCSTIISAPETWNVAHWTVLGNQYAMYYIPYPKPLFDVMAYYNAGDQVYRLGKIYTAVTATLAIDHTTLLQNITYQMVPLPNVFPEDPKYGLKYWGAGVVSTVAAGSLPTNWLAGDNRDRLLVRHLIAIALYFIHSDGRIAPRNIPVLRDLNYKEAISWLKQASKGEVTVEIAAIQPRSGGRIRYGSNIKNINTY